MFELLTQPEPSERGCHWQLHLWSDNGGAYRVKAGLFRRSSILFRPLAPAMTGGLVEPPGTAPGSEPFITGAFITIVRVAPDGANIGLGVGGCKGASWGGGGLAGCAVRGVGCGSANLRLPAGGAIFGPR